MSQSDFTNDQKTLLTLIKTALTGQKPDTAVTFQITSEMSEVIRQQHLENLVKTGLERTGNPVPQSIRAGAAQNMLHLARQHKALADLTKILDEKKIPYMVLKGGHLAQYYPSVFMRYMNDADILLRAEDIETVNVIMSSLGYRNENGWEHEVKWVKGTVLIELHIELFPSDVVDLHDYFGDGWNAAVQSQDGKWQMSPEDEYLYVLSHFAKHYRSGDPRIFHVLDHFILNQHCDKDKVMEKAAQFHLESFLRCTQKLLESWFGNADADEQVLLMTNTILEGAPEVLQERIFQAGFHKDIDFYTSDSKKKAWGIVKKFFPNDRVILGKFPEAKLNSFNRPFYWAARLIKIVFTPGRISSFAKSVHKAEDDPFQQELRSIGLAAWTEGTKNGNETDL